MRFSVHTPTVFRQNLYVLALLTSLGCICCAADQPTPNDDEGLVDGSAPETGPVDAGQDLPPPTPGPVRFVTWNCHDFFDTVLGNCDGCQFEEKLTTSQFSDKTEDVARGLASLKGDIVLLQEIENKEVLKAIAEHSSLKSLGYVTRESVIGNDPRGINIGVLSRFPITKYVSHRRDQFTRVDDPKYVYYFARDAVEVHLNVNGQAVVIIGVHFKSQANDEDPNRRIAEGQQARAIADSVLKGNPNAYVFVMGDFNDDLNSIAYKAVRDGQTGPAYQHAMMDVPSSQRYSYTYSGDRKLIDHMLVTPDVYKRFVKGSATITHDKSLSSDHAPLAATFTIP